jgi:hypothetical protein
MRADGTRWLALIVIIVVAGGGLYYQYQNTRPCTHPIPYAVGALDTRFDISKATLVSDAKAAAGIWNTAAGRTVLVYDPTAAMKINLVYDARQANATFGGEIAQQQANADNARATLDASQAQYVALQTAYNQAVDAVNARGGATKSEAAALASQRNDLNALASAINIQVDAFNASVNALNAVVEKYNQTAGYTFEEGEYVRDAAGQRINIFEFIGNLQLKRVLAHEFGHAIGLDHDSDLKSIMYAKNESGNLVATKADLAALRALCGA